ncbi:DUF4810 domain-containing protein [Chitinivorax sp. B]|uniref:DUF4810 domain-containing protein n=1 Tax=Chitinivorax sp. B TaxID=2502235 RepID=UPI0010FA4A90|nr:DUF4810 domain-containing protein [Chitinivorax sp. B]
MQFRRIGFGATLFGALFLAGCANHSQKPLYYWGQYQPQVYEYLKGDGTGPEAQIIAMEKGIQQARAKDAALPPGYHAHLGMLYLKAGRDDQVKQQFETEKTLFPESATFMDFLLKKFKN